MCRSLHFRKVLFSNVIGGSLSGLFAFPDAAQARVKIITLPVREQVEIQLRVSFDSPCPEKGGIGCEVVRLQGTSAKQNNVPLQQVEVAR